MSAPRRLLLGAGDTVISCATHLQQQGHPFSIAMLEAGNSQVERLHNRLQKQGLHPEAIASSGDELAMALARSHRIVCSPGIPISHPAVKEARSLGLAVESDLDLFTDAASAPVLAVTGTNGKSTVVSLAGQMAEQAGLNVGVGGNLGPPALTLLEPQRDFYILEVSSFQLEYSRRFRCQTGALLNLAPDHISRHGNLRYYGEIKRRIFVAAKRLIYNRDNPLTIPPLWACGQRVSFGLESAEAGNYGISDGMLCRGHEPLLGVDEIASQGAGVQPNALAALALAESMGVEPVTASKVLKDFDGLKHRFQTVLKHKGIHWIDDSKATNPSSSAAALDCVKTANGDPSVLFIAGGDAKKADLRVLANAAVGKVRLALLIGDDADKLARTLGELCPTRLCKGLREAVQIASGEARSGETVLLAPACASTDPFDNYRQRGEAFSAYAREYAL